MTELSASRYQHCLPHCLVALTPVTHACCACCLTLTAAFLFQAALGPYTKFETCMGRAKAPMVPSAPAQPEAPLTEEAKPKIKTGKPRRPPTLDVSHSVASPRPTAAAVDGGIVKVGRREAWARFLAYEVNHHPATCAVLLLAACDRPCELAASRHRLDLLGASVLHMGMQCCSTAINN